jgi:hypothetical protein
MNISKTEHRNVLGFYLDLFTFKMHNQKQMSIDRFVFVTETGDILPLSEMSAIIAVNVIDELWAFIHDPGACTWFEMNEPVVRPFGVVGVYDSNAPEERFRERYLHHLSMIETSKFDFRTVYFQIGTDGYNHLLKQAEDEDKTVDELLQSIVVDFTGVTIDPDRDTSLFDSDDEWWRDGGEPPPLGSN